MSPSQFAPFRRFLLSGGPGSRGVSNGEPGLRSHYADTAVLHSLIPTATTSKPYADSRRVIDLTIRWSGRMRDSAASSYIGARAAQLNRQSRRGSKCALGLERFSHAQLWPVR